MQETQAEPGSKFSCSDQKIWDFWAIRSFKLLLQAATSIYALKKVVLIFKLLVLCDRLGLASKGQQTLLSIAVFDNLLTVQPEHDLGGPSCCCRRITLVTKS